MEASWKRQRPEHDPQTTLTRDSAAGFSGENLNPARTRQTLAGSLQAGGRRFDSGWLHLAKPLPDAGFGRATDDVNRAGCSPRMFPRSCWAARSVLAEERGRESGREDGADIRESWSCRVGCDSGDAGCGDRQGQSCRNHANSAAGHRVRMLSIAGRSRPARTADA